MESIYISHFFRGFTNFLQYFNTFEIYSLFADNGFGGRHVDRFCLHPRGLPARTRSLVGQIALYAGKQTLFARKHLEAISKKGFWFKIAAGPRFKPEEYSRISRI